MRKQYAQYVLKHRHTYSLTQAELAGVLGVSRVHLSNVERGKILPTLRFMIAMANAIIVSRVNRGTRLKKELKKQFSLLVEDYVDEGL